MFNFKSGALQLRAVQAYNLNAISSVTRHIPQGAVHDEDVRFLLVVSDSFENPFHMMIEHSRDELILDLELRSLVNAFFAIRSAVVHGTLPSTLQQSVAFARQLAFRYGTI